MKQSVKRVGLLLLVLIAVCVFSASVMANTYPYPGTLDNRYEVVGTGTLTATRASAALTILDLSDDEYETEFYRYAKVEFKYYPSNGGGLVTGQRQKSGGDGYSCTASASTATDSGIYQFRYARFTIQARVPAASGGYHDWSGGGEDWVEFIPTD